MKKIIRNALMMMVMVLVTVVSVNTMSTDAQAAHEHTWKVVSTKKATYKKAGSQKLKCTQCKKKKTVKLAKLKCTSHNWKVTKTKKATAKKAGYKKMTCRNCGAKTTETVKAATVATNNSTAKAMNEDVSGMYGDGTDVTFTMNGKTVTGHYDAKASMELVSLLNAYRQSKGLNALATTKALTNAANIRSKETTIVFDHKRPTVQHGTQLLKK